MKKRSLLQAFAMPILATAAYLLWAGYDPASLVSGLRLVALPILFLDLAMLHDPKGSRNLYAMEVSAPLAWVGIFSLTSQLPIHTIIVFMTLPVVIACAKTMVTTTESGPELTADIKERTVTLQLMFSVLLILSLILARFI